jgi:Domain of unknown function (DUF1854)
MSKSAANGQRPITAAAGGDGPSGTRVLPGHLERLVSGRLGFTTADGVFHEGAVPVRAFPITDPQRGFSLMSAEGAELAWIETLDELSLPERALIEAELSAREFMPEIVRLTGVSGFVTPCSWYIETDRGKTTLLLKGEEDIRRLTQQTLLITDAHGIHYLIRSLPDLDRASRKLLDRFL